MKVCKHEIKRTAASHKYSCFCLSNTPTYVDIENLLFIAYTKLIAGAINSRLLSLCELMPFCLLFVLQPFLFLSAVVLAKAITCVTFMHFLPFTITDLRPFLFPTSQVSV